MPAICFVCLGNICRSPMAHAIAVHLVAERDLTAWQVDSCGTGAWHVGEGADPRTIRVLHEHGIACDHRARQLRRRDFTDFDWLLAMDDKNLQHLHGMRPDDARAQVALLGDFDPEDAGAVPDPYYGGKDGFTTVYRQVYRSCATFFDRHG